MVDDRRFVSLLLSARALPYAALCLRSLLQNAQEPITLALITDSAEDKAALTAAMEQIAPDPRHHWSIHDDADADERAAAQYARYPHFRQFRKGNPCWRKITDPPLFTPAGREMIILDPDVYFPNPFRFEATPASGLLLMWQPTNCLFPPHVVRRGFRAGIRMADHTDIGVCHAMSALDFDWLDWLVEQLGGSDLPPRAMHVESIVWAALALRVGGGYLDPKAWYCWPNPASKRLRTRLLGKTGPALLCSEPISPTLKAFHAGGRAKGWLSDAIAAGLFAHPSPQLQPYPPLPYREYHRYQFEGKHALRAVVQKLGILKIVGSPV